MTEPDPLALEDLAELLQDPAVLASRNAFFSQAELQFMDYCEQTWTADQRLPKPSECAAILDIDEETYLGYITNNNLLNELEDRGITVRSGKMLSPDQIVAINVLLDISDRRSEAAKLRELGISSRTYNNWKRDPVVQEYMRKRGEAIFGDNEHELYASLQQQIRKGNMNAIKLGLEMKGLWSSKTVGELNVEFLLMKILEIMQVHIKDPQTLAAISADVGALGTKAAQARRGELPPAVASINRTPAVAKSPAQPEPFVIDADDFAVRGFQM